MIRVPSRLAAAAMLSGAAFAAAAPAALAVPVLTASPAQVTFGSTVTLHGTAAGGQQVQLLSQACGFTDAVAVASTTAAADGTYAFRLQPALGTLFLVQAGADRSPTRAVSVAPLVQVSRTGSVAYRIDVSVGAGDFFDGNAQLQRFDPKRRVWATVAHASLKQASDAGALVAVSSARVRFAAKHGTTLRAFVPQATVGSCYRAGASAAITIG